MESSIDLFTYGTLMHSDILRAVSGVAVPGIKAELNGYARYSIKGEAFPAIIPEAGACTRGLLYRGVSPAALQRIDRYEGELYQRDQLQVRLMDGSLCAVYGYVLKLCFRHHVSESDWRFENFCARHLHAYLRDLQGSGP